MILPADTHNLMLVIGIAVMILLAWVGRYRAPRCNECSHCRLALAERKRKQHAEVHKNWGKCWDKDCPGPDKE